MLLIPLLSGWSPSIKRTLLIPWTSLYFRGGGATPQVFVWVLVISYVSYLIWPLFWFGSVLCCVCMCEFSVYVKATSFVLVLLLMWVLMLLLSLKLKAFFCCRCTFLKYRRDINPFSQYGRVLGGQTLKSQTRFSSSFIHASAFTHLFFSSSTFWSLQWML